VAQVGIRIPYYQKNSKKSLGNYTNTWKLNNTFLSNPQINGKIQKQIEKNF
jgi:hypothetical protein